MSNVVERFFLQKGSCGNGDGGVGGGRKGESVFKTDISGIRPKRVNVNARNFDF